MIINYLKQPYPYLVNKWKVISLVSLFIALFLLILQPLGLSGIRSSYKLILIAGYGVVTFLVLILDWIFLPFLFRQWFRESNWKVWKQIVWQFWVLFSIGMGNFLYSSVLFSSFWGVDGFLFFELYTCSIGIIPITTVTIINQNLRLKSNLEQANALNLGLHTNHIAGQVTTKICMMSDNQKERFEIDTADLLYIEAAANYLQVYYRKENKASKVLLRNTLQNMELQLNEFPSIERCHRAFLVNIHQINGVNGNSQGVKLQLPFGLEIPVSRTYSKQLKSKIENILS